MIIIISGIQGVGKTTIIKELLEQTSLRLSVSSTTREKRINEYHEEYEFLSLEDFKKKEKEGYFIEVINFNNNWYGTPKKELKINTIFNITASSIQNFLSCINNPYITIFISALDEVIMHRLKSRGETTKEIEEKLLISHHEKKFQNYFQYIVENNDFNTTINQILQIINNFMIL
jgi:guanylate kinase